MLVVTRLRTPAAVWMLCTILSCIHASDVLVHVSVSLYSGSGVASMPPTTSILTYLHTCRGTVVC